MKNKKAQISEGAIAGGILLICAIIVGIIWSLFAGFDTVDTGNYGVILEFGRPVGSMGPGMQWNGVFKNVVEFDMRMRKFTLNINTRDLAASDMYGQDFYGTITLNYHINPTRIEEMFNTAVKNDEDVENKLLLKEKTMAAFKAVAVQYEALQGNLKEAEISAKTCEIINTQYKDSFIIIDYCQVWNTDMNQAFKDQIELRKVEEQRKLTAEKTRDAELINNEIAVNTAKKNAEIAKTTADADFYAKNKQTDAVAYNTLEIARAEAEGLRLKRTELTDLMVQNNMIDRWNGQLPLYQLGEGNNLLMSLPTK